MPHDESKQTRLHIWLPDGSEVEASGPIADEVATKILSRLRCERGEEMAYKGWTPTGELNGRFNPGGGRNE